MLKSSACYPTTTLRSWVVFLIIASSTDCRVPIDGIIGQRSFAHGSVVPAGGGASERIIPHRSVAGATIYGRERCNAETGVLVILTPWDTAHSRCVKIRSSRTPTLALRRR